ncbi:MAG: hypothetical protein BMS9Abin01_0569 [Gammaproteobacteria bacterium]|nr:MAG: hypothetical protein BMS9Abin01_0569 [Gammaproteobacteria bacterium]
MGPLAGLKVIEFAHIMAGPVCGLMLADMGADVIKVEKVPGGDDTRRTLPPEIEGESAAFLMMNRNKRGVAINLKTGNGRSIARRLLADADVAIENYRKGTMERLGLGYQEDPRFAEDSGRMANIDELVAILGDIFKRRPAGDWLERLEGAGVPAGPVLDIAGMQADPQALARGMVAQAPHTRVGPVKTLGHPVHYSVTPAEITRAAPLLGEHTVEVLAQHGYSEAEVEKFVVEGAVIAEKS